MSRIANPADCVFSEYTVSESAVSYSRRPLPNGRGFHEKAGLCQAVPPGFRGSQGACPLAECEAAPHAPSKALLRSFVRRSSEPTEGRHDALPHDQGPLSLISVGPSGRRQPLKGARFRRGLRTLDRLPPAAIINAEGKGAGGLRGLAPWRSLRQRLMRASRALLSPASIALPVFLLSLNGPSAR